jgi:hypothetical protein
LAAALTDAVGKIVIAAAKVVELWRKWRRVMALSGFIPKL